jgi:hypothetical protein
MIAKEKPSEGKNSGKGCNLTGTCFYLFSGMKEVE